MINNAVNASLHSIMKPSVQHELTEYQITAAIITIFTPLIVQLKYI